MALGTDIVKISRMQRLIEDSIPQKVFSRREAEYINSKKDKAQTAAGIFAAKEAVLKAMGLGIILPLNEVEICHNQNGMPYVEFSEKAMDCFKGMGFKKTEISISHDGEYAIASAYITPNELFEFAEKIKAKFKIAPQNAITPKTVHPLLPIRQSASHKGSYGRLYVLAGSKGLTGAAIMACTSALRCGAGLISLGCAEELNSIFEISMKEVMTKPLKSKNGLITKEDMSRIEKDIAASDVCLIGPGLGISEDLKEIAASAIEHSTTPLVIDADGLNAIVNNTEVLNKCSQSVVITPHIGEFARLTGYTAEEILSDTEKYAKEFSQKHKVHVILKSHKTVVATPDGKCYVNILGNPGMATGGSGDVLAGAVASFLCQGNTPENAAILGVYIHSLAADMAAAKLGEYSLTPSDIIDHISKAILFTQNN